MKLRHFTSIGLLISGVILIVTGLWLFFGIGAARMYIKGSHEIFSFSFILFMLVHTALNFRPLVNYCKNVKSRLPVSGALLGNGVLAAAMLAVCINIASTQLDGGTGEPYPAVESMPLEVVLESSGIDRSAALAALVDAGYVVPDGELSLGALSQANRCSPQKLFSCMSSAAR